MIVDFATAVMDRLTAGLDPVPVHDGEVPPKPEFPYVVLWTSAPLRSSDRLCGTQANGLVRFQTSSVGVSPEQVRRVQQRVHDALIDALLVVAGRNLARVKHDASRLLDNDFDARPDPESDAYFLAADQWSVFSSPA